MESPQAVSLPLDVLVLPGAVPGGGEVVVALGRRVQVGLDLAGQLEGFSLVQD